jgi:hypothetical protein
LCPKETSGGKRRVSPPDRALSVTEKGRSVTEKRRKPVTRAVTAALAATKTPGVFAWSRTASTRGPATALSLAALLLGCSVPEIEFYDAAVGGETAADTGAVDRTTDREDSGQDVTTGVDAREGEAEADSVAADVASGGDSSDAADEPQDGASDAADASTTTDDADAPPDAGDASSPDAFDAAEAGATDAPAEDAEADDGPAEANDGSFINTCPSPTPPGVTRCCAHTPCIERQGNSCNCGACMHCGAICCADSQGNTSCVATPADCR